MMALRRPVWRRVGYGLFGCAAFFVSLYLTCPADLVAQRLSYELQKMTRGVWRFDAAHASMYRFSGLSFDHVTFEHQEPGETMQKLVLDTLRVRIRLLPLLLGRKSFVASAALRDATASAVVEPRGQAFDAQLTGERIDLAALPMLGAAVGLPLGGKLSAKIEASMDQNALKSAATADLALEAGSVGPGGVAGISLPSISLGQMTMSAALKDGKLRLLSFKQTGGQVALGIKATATLRNPLLASGVDACVTVRPAEAFLSANPTMRAGLQLAAAQFKIDPDNTLHLPIAGLLSAPQVGSTRCP